LNWSLNCISILIDWSNNSTTTEIIAKSIQLLCTFINTKEATNATNFRKAILIALSRATASESILENKIYRYELEKTVPNEQKIL
jgi:hypothetical protein